MRGTRLHMNNQKQTPEIQSLTSSAASNCKRTGIGDPKVGVMTPARSRAL